MNDSSRDEYTHPLTTIRHFLHMVCLRVCLSVCLVSSEDDDGRHWRWHLVSRPTDRHFSSGNDITFHLQVSGTVYLCGVSDRFTQCNTFGYSLVIASEISPLCNLIALPQTRVTASTVSIIIISSISPQLPPSICLVLHCQIIIISNNLIIGNSQCTDSFWCLCNRIVGKKASHY